MTEQERLDAAAIAARSAYLGHDRREQWQAVVQAVRESDAKTAPPPVEGVEKLTARCVEIFKDFPGNATEAMASVVRYVLNTTKAPARRCECQPSKGRVEDCDNCLAGEYYPGKPEEIPTAELEPLIHKASEDFAESVVAIATVIAKAVAVEPKPADDLTNRDWRNMADAVRAAVQGHRYITDNPWEEAPEHERDTYLRAADVVARYLANKRIAAAVNLEQQPDPLAWWTPERVYEGAWSYWSRSKIKAADFAGFDWRGRLHEYGQAPPLTEADAERLLAAHPSIVRVKGGWACLPNGVEKEEAKVEPLAPAKPPVRMGGIRPAK